MDYTKILKEVCAELDLGVLLEEPIRIFGGLTHKMFKVETDKNSYIIKLLNPNIMKRPTALKNYQTADALENKLQENKIPIVGSLLFNGQKMQNIEGQYFYIFPWYNGRSLKDNEITKLNCQKIGKTMADIHKISVIEKNEQKEQMIIDWESYIELEKEKNPTICELLKDNVGLLYKHMNLYNSSLHQIPNIQTICHNDMDSKNVLWINDDFKIIDLECLNYSNPYLELFQITLCWSGYETCNIDFDLFKEFINSYFENNKLPDIDWEIIYNLNMGRLEWLEFNLKRSLMIECDTIEEQELGVKEVKETLEHVIYYENIKDEILKNMKEIGVDRNV